MYNKNVNKNTQNRKFVESPWNIAQINGWEEQTLWRRSQNNHVANQWIINYQNFCFQDFDNVQCDAYYLFILTILSNFERLSWLWCNGLHLCKIVKLLHDSFIGGNCKIVMIDVPLVISFENKYF
jgi:hypothetical protein